MFNFVSKTYQIVKNSQLIIQHDFRWFLTTWSKNVEKQGSAQNRSWIAMILYPPFLYVLPPTQIATRETYLRKSRCQSATGLSLICLFE